MYTREVLMDLDRGTLAKIDRKLLSGLDDQERYQTARVPASEALWSAWRRYCAALGVSMGRGIVGLIVHELGATIADPEDGPAFAWHLEKRLRARVEELDARERRLEERERAVREGERHLRARTVPLPPSYSDDIGRNDPCPCGSGLKYKRCHGS